MWGKEREREDWTYGTRSADCFSNEKKTRAKSFFTPFFTHCNVVTQLWYSLTTPTVSIPFPSLHGISDQDWYTSSSLCMLTSQSVLVSPFWKTLQWSGNREETRIGIQHTEKTCLKKVEREGAVGTFESLCQLSEVPNRLSHFPQPWAPSAWTTFSSPTPTMVFPASFNNPVPYQQLSPTYV